MATPEQTHTVVVGGGQAGLAVGYHLAQRNVPFVILDANPRVGDAWRQRWDSLRLFSIRRYSHLDGMRLPGFGHGFPTKDEIADYLEAYASKFSLPVRNGVRVNHLSRHGDHFLVEAGTDCIEAQNIVVAMATLQVPYVPELATALDESIRQLHSAKYRNPAELEADPVLVVGAGNSGCEIALEIASAGHQTVLAGDIGEHVPFRIETIPACFVMLPLLFRMIAHHVLTVRTPIGRRRRPKVLSGNSPVVRVKPKELTAAGVRRTGRIVGVRDGHPIDADGTHHDVSTVIWCTGFRPDFTWIDLPVFGEYEPDHHRGVVAQQPGLYFAGLPFQYAMSSAFLRGVSRDAAHVARHIATRAYVADAPSAV